MVAAAHEQRLALAPDLSALRAARAFVRGCCADLALPDQLVGTATLLTSELVSNAVRHTGGPGSLVVTTVPGGVRVEVGDASPVRPTASMPAPEADSGRGLMFVELMATRWGVRDEGPGKVVWFELVGD